MLYRAYSNPMDLMGRFINQGRFDVFVSGFIKEEVERKQAEMEKENDRMLWAAYIHAPLEIQAKMNYAEWKAEVTGKKKAAPMGGNDATMTEKEMENILKKLSLA